MGLAERVEGRMLPDPWTYPGNPVSVQYQGPITDRLRDVKRGYGCATVVDASWMVAAAFFRLLDDPQTASAARRALDALPTSCLDIYSESFGKRSTFVTDVTKPGHDVTNVTADVTKRPLTPAERKRLSRERKKDEPA